jgi:hypothetical protein
VAFYSSVGATDGMQIIWQLRNRGLPIYSTAIISKENLKKLFEENSCGGNFHRISKGI